MTERRELALSCPAPAVAGETVQLAHGGGGRVMARLIDTLIRPVFADPEIDRRHDGAVLEIGGPLAFTTDSYVVRPLVFPGGDIGTLAVNGTVNDLAMCGARPLYLSVGLILEEGLPLDLLHRILASMRAAAVAAGIGRVLVPAPLGPHAVRPGDRVIVSGDIGRHGIAVLAAREGFGFESAIESDCAPLAEPVLALIEAGIAVHCLRDLTRGGLASAAVEIAETAGCAIALDEAAIPVRAEIAAACELLGLDPLHVANEGRFVAFVAPDDADRAVAVLRRHPIAAAAAMIGVVHAAPAGQVWCRGPLGIARTIDMLSGEQLPRIC